LMSRSTISSPNKNKKTFDEGTSRQKVIN